MKLGIGFSQAALTEENLQYAKTARRKPRYHTRSPIWRAGRSGVHRTADESENSSNRTV